MKENTFKPYEQALEALAAAKHAKQNQAAAASTAIDAAIDQRHDLIRERDGLVATGDIDAAEAVQQHIDAVTKRLALREQELSAVDQEISRGCMTEVRALVAAHTQSLANAQKALADGDKRLLDLKAQMETAAEQQRAMVQRCMAMVKAVHAEMHKADLNAAELPQLQRGYGPDKYFPKLGSGINPKIDPPQVQRPVDWESHGVGPEIATAEGMDIGPPSMVRTRTLAI